MPPKVGQSGMAPLIKKTVTVDSQSANVGLPNRLTIPALNISAAVAFVGNAADGSMDISPNQDDVAWYKLGPRPGEIGSAVIAGHYGSLRGKFSVFSDLSQLKKGDKLQVQDYKERLVTFVVRESRMYDPAADATDVFNSHDGKVHLNLITCEGSWNNAKESYSNRRVVFTDKEIQ
ncbi:MAG: class F sortase [Candidatus Saccharibacteria bacterium]